MDKSKYIELINRHIDGELDADEIEQLESVLSANPDARKTYQELTNIASRLDRIEMVEPPVNLLSRILQRIDVNLYRADISEKISFWQQWAEFILPRRNVAMAFVTGLIVGIICIFVFADQSQIKDVDILGTIGAGTDVESQTILDQEGIIEGVYKIKKTGDVYFVIFDLSCADPCIATLKYQQKELLLSGYQSYTPESVSFESSANSLRIAMNGDSRFTMRFDTHNANQNFIFLEIVTGQKMLIKKKISLK